MYIFAPILAAADIVSILVTIFIIGSLVVRVLYGLAEGGAKKPGQPARPQQQPPGPGQNKPLRDEVEEFLRRAKANLPGKAKANGPRASGAGPVVQAEVIQAEAVEEPRGGGVAAHVERHIAPNPIAEHTRELGREVGLADEQLESHLRQTFDHELSRLDDGAAATLPQIAQGTDAEVWKTESSGEQQPAHEPSLAGEIAAMFREPEGAQRAIVLSEILNPPEHRWEK